MKNQIVFLVVIAALTGCASKEVMPDKVEVKVTRDEAGKNCTLIGPVSGSVVKIGESADVAMVNLKKDAARRGANFVHYEAASADGSGLKGMGYYCP